MGVDDARPARAAASLARVVELALADAGLSLAQYRLLAYLSRGSSAASPAARDLSTSRPSVTALVDGVVAKGLVERFPDPDDRRRITLVLTPLGFDVLDRADAAAVARLAAVASYLPPDDAARALEGLPLWTDAVRAEAAAQSTVAPGSRP
jgi:long-chain acyl-CoA synthetase